MLLVFRRHAGKDFASMNTFLQQRQVVNTKQLETLPVHGETVVAVMDISNVLHLGI